MPKLHSLSDFMRKVAPPPKYAVKGKDGKFKPKPRQGEQRI
jgi:hypothetical protein